jgi:hypothetical protein
LAWALTDAMLVTTENDAMTILLDPARRLPCRRHGGLPAAPVLVS